MDLLNLNPFRRRNRTLAEVLIQALMLVLVLLPVLALAGCGEESPTAPTNIVIVNNNTNTNGGGAGPGSGTPGSGAAGTTLKLVKVTQYGEDTTSTCSSVSGEDRSVRIGCIKRITCTPFVEDANGNLVPAPPSVHGTNPDYFGVTSGSDKVATSVWSDNAFNIDAKGLKVGEATFTCIVKGLQNQSPFVLTVVP